MNIKRKDFQTSPSAVTKESMSRVTVRTITMVENDNMTEITEANRS